MNAQTLLSKWLADGQLRRALTGLSLLAQQHGSKDLENVAKFQSGRLGALLTEQGRGTVASETFLIEQNRIRAAAQQLVDGLDPAWPADALAAVPSEAAFVPKKAFSWKKWAAGIAAVVAFVAGVVKFTGYPLRDLFPKPAPPPVEKPEEPKTVIQGDQVIQNGGMNIYSKEDVNVSLPDADYEKAAKPKPKAAPDPTQK